MTRNQKYAARAGAAVGLGLLVWWLWPKKKVGRRTSEYIIDDNVMSPTFGLPVYGPPTPPELVRKPGDVADNPVMQRLIDASNAAIAADDAQNRG